MKAKVDDLAIARLLRAGAANHPGTIRWYSEIARRTTGVERVSVAVPSWGTVEVTVELGIRAWLPWVRRRFVRLLNAVFSYHRPAGVEIKIHCVRKLRSRR